MSFGTLSCLYKPWRFELDAELEFGRSAAEGRAERSGPISARRGAFFKGELHGLVNDFTEHWDSRTGLTMINIETNAARARLETVPGPPGFSRRRGTRFAEKLSSSTSTPSDWRAWLIDGFR